MLLIHLKSIGCKATCPILTFLLNAILIPVVSAQSTVTTTDYLQTISKSFQRKGNDYKLSFLREYNYNLPLIKGVQLRSETKDFLLNKQEFSMRIAPNSLSAISRQKEVYYNKIEKAGLENQLSLNEEIENRYFQIIDYVFAEELTQLYEEKQLQLKGKLRVLRQSIYNTDFDITDLVNTEDELLSLKVKLEDLKNTKLWQQALMRGVMSFQGDSLEFNFNDLINPWQIIEKSKTKNGNVQRLEVRLQKLELNILKSEMRLNQAKSNQLLDYVQAKYEGSNDFALQENFSVGIGINLSFSPNRQNKGDYYFDKLNEESKLMSLKKEVEYDENETVFEFEKAIANYQISYRQMTESSAVSIYAIYRKMEGVSPLLLIKLQLLQIDKKMNAIQARHELYKSYISVLSNREILFQKPLRNHLSAASRFINP